MIVLVMGAHDIPKNRAPAFPVSLIITVTGELAGTIPVGVSQKAPRRQLEASWASLISTKPSA
jgi:hypothetical protein